MHARTYAAALIRETYSGVTFGGGNRGARGVFLRGERAEGSAVGVGNVILLDTQSIDGLWWVSQLYLNTAVVGEDRLVT